MVTVVKFLVLRHLHDAKMAVVVQVTDSNYEFGKIVRTYVTIPSLLRTAGEVLFMQNSWSLNLS